MICRQVKDPFDRKGWICELKYDGFRCVSEVGKDRRVELYSRKHNPFNKRFPAIVESLGNLQREAILDGEVVALDAEGFRRFEVAHQSQRSWQRSVDLFRLRLAFSGW